MIAGVQSKIVKYVLFILDDANFFKKAPRALKVPPNDVLLTR